MEFKPKFRCLNIRKGQVRQVPSTHTRRGHPVTEQTSNKSLGKWLPWRTTLASIDFVNRLWTAWRQLTRRNYQASTRHGCTSMVYCQDSSGRWPFTRFQQQQLKWSNVEWTNTSGDGLVFRPVSLTLDSTWRQQSCNYWKSSLFQWQDWYARDQLIRQAGIETRTNRKWSVSQAFEQAETSLERHAGAEWVYGTT